MANYKRKDHLYQKAKEDGYRSRAAYKLKEIQKKYHLIRRGDLVLDLGCWPGSWLEVASEYVNEEGRVVGIDLVQTEVEYNNCETVVGDITDSEVIALLKRARPYSVVMSDMSPKLTGITLADNANIEEICLAAEAVMEECLGVGGNFVVKMFKSQECNVIADRLKKRFDNCYRTELDSSRSSSKEFYLIGIGKRQS